jgi:hypothetical protein
MCPAPFLGRLPTAVETKRGSTYGTSHDIARARTPSPCERGHIGVEVELCAHTANSGQRENGGGKEAPWSRGQRVHGARAMTTKEGKVGLRAATRHGLEGKERARLADVCRCVSRCLVCRERERDERWTSMDDRFNDRLKFS